MVYFHKTMALLLVSFALVLASRPLPPALSQDSQDQENSLRDLCLNNIRPEQCWEIIKTNYDGFNTDKTSAAYTAIDLARGKGVEILGLVATLPGESWGGALNDGYTACASNYRDSIEDLDKAKIHLDSGKFGTCYYISTQIHNALNDLRDCRHSFDKGSYDPLQMLDKNREFFVYAQIAYAATKRVDNINGSCD